jgi:hypothetical protein
MEKNTENILSTLKTKETAYSVAAIYIFLILLTLILLYNHGTLFANSVSKEKTDDQNSLGLTIFAIISFTLLAIAFIIVLLPSFKNIEKLFGQINKTIYVVLYTIFLILFFRLIPSDTLNSYAFLFVPLTIFGTIYFFSNAFKTNYIKEFNINYERIKMILLFFSLITIIITYYSVDPGGYIQKNFGYSLLLTILLAVFSFLYLIIVLTMHNTNLSGMKGGSNANGASNATNATNAHSSKKSGNSWLDFSHYNYYILFTNIFFIIFVVLLGVGIKSYPDGFFSNVGVSTAVIIFTMLIFILWACILAVNYYPDITSKILDDSQMNLFNKSILVILGVTISGLLIAWLTYNIQNYMGGTFSTFGLLLNIIMALVILTFIYKIINVKQPTSHGSNNKITKIIDLIKNVIFYIPCLFSGLFDSVMKFFVKEYNQTTTGNVYFLGFTVLMILFYFLFFYLKGKLGLQGGKSLVNDPINTNTLHTLGTYKNLNGTDDHFNYQYGISFWVYIDSMPPNNNISYTKYTSLVNYGNKPNIVYKADTNEFAVTMDSGRVYNKSKDFEYINNEQLNDKNKTIIVYRQNDFLLQKWNHVIVNYQGGTLDIFMNGELVKSVHGVVPYMSLDTLTVGSDNGIQGGVSNLLYFKRPLTISNIYYLYHSQKK